MRLHTKTGIILASALTAVTLVACSPQASPADDGTITVVASTNVYGNLAELVGGELINVTSIINNPAQDPHSFEADARVQLTLSKADIVIENGGGYDAFVDQLLSSLDVPGQVVLSAVELSPLALDDHADDHAESESDDHADHDHGTFNEHLWYDFPTVAAVAEKLRDSLATLDPDNAKRYHANTQQLLDELDALTQRAATIRSAHDGTGVAITEPVPLYLLEAAGLHNVTPVAFSNAIEGGGEVSAATLKDTLSLFSTGKASLLVYNDQTTSPETEALLAAAGKAGVPIVSVTELLPEGTSYIGWMNGILDSLDAALSAV